MKVEVKRDDRGRRRKMKGQRRRSEKRRKTERRRGCGVKMGERRAGESNRK